MSIFTATWISSFQRSKRMALVTLNRLAAFSITFLKLSDEWQEKLSNLEKLSESTIQCGQRLSFVFTTDLAITKRRFLLIMSKMWFALYTDSNSISWTSHDLVEFKGLCDLYQQLLIFRFLFLWFWLVLLVVVVGWLVDWFLMWLAVCS